MCITEKRVKFIFHISGCHAPQPKPQDMILWVKKKTFIWEINHCNLQVKMLANKCWVTMGRWHIYLVIFIFCSLSARHHSVSPEFRLFSAPATLWDGYSFTDEETCPLSSKLQSCNSKGKVSSQPGANKPVKPKSVKGGNPLFGSLALFTTLTGPFLSHFGWGGQTSPVPAHTRLSTSPLEASIDMEMDKGQARDSGNTEILPTLLCYLYFGFLIYFHTVSS